jgi:hypothetical protein
MPFLPAAVADVSVWGRAAVHFHGLAGLVRGPGLRGIVWGPRGESTTATGSSAHVGDKSASERAMIGRVSIRSRSLDNQTTINQPLKILTLLLPALFFRLQKRAQLILFILRLSIRRHLLVSFFSRLRLLRFFEPGEHIIS